MTHEIVIIGGSFSGIFLAHTYFQKILPSLPQSTREQVKLTLISPSTEFYYTLAGLRALVEPELIDNSTLYQEYLPHFEKYKDPKLPNSGLHFVHGYVKNLDSDNKSIQVQLTSGSDFNKDANSESIKLKYDTVVIATGAATNMSTFKMTLKDGSEAKAELRKLADQIKASQHIAIGGAGPLGCELAAEIAETWPEKNVTLYAGSRGVMSNVQPRFGKEIHTRLVKDFRVEVVSGVRVKSATVLASSGAKVKLTLTDGSTNTVDLYIPASGETPNTSFLPKSFLTESGYVDTDDQMRIKGYPRTYAVGDVSKLSNRVLDDAKRQVAVLKQVLLAELPCESDADLASVNVKEKFVTIDPLEKKFGISLGRYGGVGMVNGFKVPSIVIRFAKSKDMGLPKGQHLVAGHATV